MRAQDDGFHPQNGGSNWKEHGKRHGNCIGRDYVALGFRGAQPQTLNGNTRIFRHVLPLVAWGFRNWGSERLRLQAVLASGLRLPFGLLGSDILNPKS